MSPSKLTLRCASGALVAAFAGSTPAHAADAVAAAQCSNLDVAPRANNAEGLRTLRENTKLRRAALAHSSDMIRGGFFSHTARDGATDFGAKA